MAAKKNGLEKAADAQFDNMFTIDESDMTPETPQQTEQENAKPVIADQPQDDKPVEAENPKKTTQPKRKATKYRTMPELATEPKRERLQMLLEKSTKKRLEKAARKKKMSMNEYALEALKAQLEKDGQ